MSDFTEAFAHQTRGVEHISVGRLYSCDDPACGGDLDDSLRNASTILDDEGSFSWSRCDGCGSTLGGNRYAAHGVITILMGAGADRPVETMIHMDVCVDCLAYIANGDEPEVWG